MVTENGEDERGARPTTNAPDRLQIARQNPDGTPINPKDNGTIAAGGLPPGWNAATPYDASLQYISVFGKLASKRSKLLGKRHERF